ncbi:MAG: tetratricopeptide repeat protein, partial [Terriglobia bacterium]
PAFPGAEPDSRSPFETGSSASLARAREAHAERPGLLDELRLDLEASVAEPAATKTPPPVHPTLDAPAKLGAPMDSDSLGALFHDLLAGLDVAHDERAAPDTPQAHYNLGVAFREMGLLDEAIAEFQKVVRGAGKQNLPPRFLEACSALGMCFMEKAMPAIALRWYRRALDAPEVDEEISLGLSYDLGRAYEESGDTEAAFEKFSEVYSLNIDYRDVAERVHSLQRKRH